MLKQHASNIKYLNVITDLVFTGIAFWFAFYFRHLTRSLWRYGSLYFPEDYPVGIFIILPIWGILSFYFHSRHYYRFTSIKTEISLSAKVSTIGVILLLLIQYFLKLTFFPRSFLLIFFLVSNVSLFIGRISQHRFISFIQKKGYNIKTLLIVGCNDRSEKFINTINSHKEWGLQVTGAVDINGHNGINKFCGIKIRGNADNFMNIIHKYSTDEVAFAFSFEEYGKIKPLMDICAEEGTHYFLISDFFSQKIGAIYTDRIFNIPIIYFSPIPKFIGSGSLIVKRIIDIFSAILLLLLLSPMFFIIAILIKITSNGPVFYRWRVVGQNKKSINSYKFRTMVINADEIKETLMDQNEMQGAVFKMKDDPRIAKIGRFLRKYSLDELPQLWSVLKGDLSLVGPRPPLQSELPHFGHWQRRKLSVKPGITCLWQIKGRNQITNFDDWVKLDLEYIDNWSLWLDFKILLKTFWVVIKGTGR